MYRKKRLCLQGGLCCANAGISKQEKDQISQLALEGKLSSRNVIVRNIFPGNATQSGFNFLTILHYYLDFI